MSTPADPRDQAAKGAPFALQPRKGLALEIFSDPHSFFLRSDERPAAAVSDLQAVAKAPVKTLDLLAFFVGGEEYGISIACIQEIVKLPTLTVVPKTPPHVLGIISLRGTIVPVVDLRTVLGVTRAPLQRSARLFVLRNEAQPLAMLVDAVSQVVRLDRSHIEPRPEGAVSRNNRYIESIGRIGARMLIVLDPPALLTILEVAS